MVPLNSLNATDRSGRRWPDPVCVHDVRGKLGGKQPSGTLKGQVTTGLAADLPSLTATEKRRDIEVINIDSLRLKLFDGNPSLAGAHRLGLGSAHGSTPGPLPCRV